MTAWRGTGPPSLAERTAGTHPAIPVQNTPPADSVPLSPVALYIHVPFCLSLCPYCDFVVYAGGAARGPNQRMDAFREALHVELGLRADALRGRFRDARPPLQSVYIGGGTPSLLGAPAIGALLDQVEQRFGIASEAEITLEANPGPQDRGDLAGFRAAGVTRLSLGVQSLAAAELRVLGRRHRVEDVAVSVEEARHAGFRDVSLDLLYDIPGQTPASWAATLGHAVALEPDHLSTYALTLELDDISSSDHLPVARGARAWRLRAASAQDEDRAADLDALADELLEPAGYRRYEIANRARPGHESRHNLAYWQRLPYEAVGPGAHAFDGDRRRRWNAANLAAYIGALVPSAANRSAAPGLPPGGEDVLDRPTASAERVILGLRLSSGVRVDLAAEPAFAAALEWGMEFGLVERTDDAFRLTPRGRLLSNEIFARLLPEPHQEPARPAGLVPAAVEGQPPRAVDGRAPSARRATSTGVRPAA